ARCDLFVRGCTLYLTPTGQPPFASGTPLEKINRHRFEEPAPVPQFNSAVPPAFIGLLRKMIAKNPEHRFAAAAEVQQKLTEWASESSTPLDKQGEREYQEAVAAMEAAEAAEEVVE